MPYDFLADIFIVMHALQTRSVRLSVFVNVTKTEEKFVQIFINMQKII